MRGRVEPEGALFFYFSPHSRISAEHPLRLIKRYTDEELAGPPPVSSMPCTLMPAALRLPRSDCSGHNCSLP
jgi:hypothetical protein